MVENLPAVQETRVQSLGQEDPLEKGMGTHSSILAWRIPWTEKVGGLHPQGCEESVTTERLRVRALEALESAHCLQVESTRSPGAHLTGFSLRRVTLHIACCTLKIIVSYLKKLFWKRVNSRSWNSFMARSEVTCSTLTVLHCCGGRAVSCILAACSLEVFSLHLLNT